jgi:hypothetical protein
MVKTLRRVRAIWYLLCLSQCPQFRLHSFMKVLKPVLLSDNHLCIRHEVYCILTPILLLPMATTWDLYVLSVVRKYQPKETWKYISKLTDQRESTVVTSVAECECCPFFSRKSRLWNLTSSACLLLEAGQGASSYFSCRIYFIYRWINIDASHRS